MLRQLEDVMAWFNPITTTVDSSGWRQVSWLLGYNLRNKQWWHYIRLATRFWIADDTTSSVFIQGNSSSTTMIACFPNFRSRPRITRICSPRTAQQQSIVYRFKLRDFGLKKGNCVDHRWQWSATWINSRYRCRDCNLCQYPRYI